ncbi:hypothetical protein E2C01_030337 [Portunus trituberculatus]|uniref:Uncharacterized protein n=1 Tax=Portunus trituberculatus TaxID=210409 RepID=A0A5B7EUL3_PORTR|nr:hypothetical protein [Portunus trituberculatus]
MPPPSPYSRRRGPCPHPALMTHRCQSKQASFRPSTCRNTSFGATFTTISTHGPPRLIHDDPIKGNNA